MSAQARAIKSDADHAAWLKQSLARLPEAKFQIAGLSIAGFTAANLALHAPLHVASATLIDPVSVVDGIPHGQSCVRFWPPCHSCCVLGVKASISEQQAVRQ